MNPFSCKTATKKRQKQSTPQTDNCSDNKVEKEKIGNNDII